MSTFDIDIFVFIYLQLLFFFAKNSYFWELGTFFSNSYSRKSKAAPKVFFFFLLTLKKTFIRQKLNLMLMARHCSQDTGLENHTALFLWLVSALPKPKPFNWCSHSWNLIFHFKGNYLPSSFQSFLFPLLGRRNRV